MDYGYKKIIWSTAESATLPEVVKVSKKVEGGKLVETKRKKSVECY